MPIRPVLNVRVAAFLIFAVAPIASAQQIVHLDFDSGEDPGRINYTTDQRDDIQAMMEADYAPFNFIFTQTAPGAGPFSTITFNTGPQFGVAEGIDFRNLNRSDNATINVSGNGLTSQQEVVLSANVASHELGHLQGLRHYDSFGPIGSGIDPNTLDPGTFNDFFPSYPGPQSATDTPFDLMESDNFFIEADVDQYFGQRSALKLTFNEFGVTQSELGDAGATLGTAQALAAGLLNVPDLGAGGFLATAASVTGALDFAGDVDLYSFLGQADSILTVEVMSQALNRIGDSIDSYVRLLDANGALVSYYGTFAVNDDEYETFDSILLDVVLPSTGTYYLEVSASSFAPGDTGGYELFYYADVAAVPEPGTWALVSLAAVGGAWRLRRNRRLSQAV